MIRLSNSFNVIYMFGTLRDSSFALSTTLAQSASGVNDNF